MNICFFSERGDSYKIPRNFNNSRTEIAWQIALNTNHNCISNLPNIQNSYDLGIIIIPKKHIDVISQIDIVGNMKRICKKMAFMQEGPCWYFEDYSLEHQIWFYNILMQMDILFCHNQQDVNYFSGLTNKQCLWMPSLMIEDNIKPIENKDYKGVIIGGNFCNWYSGFPSYICAGKSNMPIYAPSMGRKIQHEEQMENLHHLPYLNWTDWINTLQHFKFGVHLMKTHAAGTFALNCAYWGIPCIGYKGLMTQEICHPDLSVELNDLKTACELSKQLSEDDGFYKEMSEKSKQLYQENFHESVFLKRFEEYKNLIMK